MNTTYRRSKHVAAIAFMMLASAWLAACNACPVGQEVTIPSSDSTDPSVTMDFHLPNGSIVTVTPSTNQPPIVVAGGGTVTVIVNAGDGEGVKDVQIWAAEAKYTIDPSTGLRTSTGPGLLSFPTASNPANAGPGQKGCTQRVASQNLEVKVSSQGGTDFEVHASGLNFGGAVVSTPLIELQGQ